MGSQGVGSAHRVFYAPLQQDGTIGAWTAGPSLPEGVFSHGSVAVNGTLYVLGGHHFNNGLFTSNAVYYSRIGADGAPGAWQTANALPEAVFYLSAAAHNGTVYVTGGWNGQTLTRGVYSADSLQDGSLSAWRSEVQLPEAVYTHAAVANGTLYVLGGVVNNGTQIHNTVYYARINADKTLAPWQTGTPLPQALSNHAGIVANGRVFVAGGWTGPAATDAAIMAPANGDGSLGEWSSLATLPHALYLHAAATVGGRLYVSGGSNGSGQRSEVYSIPLPEAPGPSDVLPPRTALAIGAPQYGTAPLFVAPATSLSLSAADDALVIGDGAGVGVAGTRYAIDQGAFASYTAPFTISGDGAKTVRFASTDNLQQAEAEQSATLSVDGTAPVSSVAVGAPQAQLAGGGIVVSPATALGVSAQDPLAGGVASGVAEVLYAVGLGALGTPPASFTLAGPDGERSVRTQARDNIGNLEAERATALFVDGTAPATVLGVPAGAILPASALISFAAADPVTGGVASGVAATRYATDGGAEQDYAGPFPLAEGVHQLSYRSIDGVANEEAPQSASVSVDATPPITMYDAGMGAEFFGGDILTPDSPITLSAEDPVSNGVASGVDRILYSIDGGVEQAYSAPLRLSAGAHTLAYHAVDRAGNAEETTTVPISIGTFLSDSLAAYDGVDLSGAATVVGAVRTNGLFEADGLSRVRGDVTALRVKIGQRAQVSGTITEGVATLPAQLFDLNAAKAYAQAHNGAGNIPSAFMKDGALVLDGRDRYSLPEGVYYLTGVKVTGGARLEVSGKAQVFVSGRVRVDGGGVVNRDGSASDLWIFSEGDEVRVSGIARAAFHLFAPKAEVEIKGFGQHAGRVLGKSARLSGLAFQPSDETLQRRWRKGRLKHLPLAAAKPGSGKVPGFCRGRAAELLLARLENAAHDGKVGREGVGAGSGWTARSYGRARPESKFSTPPALKLSADAALSVVTGAGSSVRTDSGGGVVVPAQAVSAGLAITVSPENKADAAQVRRRENDAAQKALRAAAAAVEFGPHGTRFTKKVTLELPYRRASLPAGVVEAALAVHYWNESKGEWEQLPSSVDTVAQLVRAQTDHFSLYGLFSGGSPSATDGFSFGEVYAYPNPGQTPKIRAEAPGAETIQIRVYDASGELKHSAEISGGSADHPVGGLSSGVYVFTVTANKNGQGSIRQTGRLAVVR